MFPPVSDPLLPQAASSSAAPSADIILMFIEVPICCDSESSRSGCEPASQSGRSCGEIRAFDDKYGDFDVAHESTRLGGPKNSWLTGGL
jgi:hypothetical protein